MQFSEGVVSSDITDMDKSCDVVWKKSVACSKCDTWDRNRNGGRGPLLLSNTEKPWAAESVTPVNENIQLRYFSREDEDFWKNEVPALEGIPDDGTA